MSKNPEKSSKIWKNHQKVEKTRKDRQNVE